MRIKKNLIGRKAQELVVFAFVAPIMLLLLFAIIEFGYVLMIRNTVENNIHNTTSFLNTRMYLTGTVAERTTEFEEKVRNDLVMSLKNLNIPNVENRTVVYIQTHSNGMILLHAAYTYKPLILVPFGIKNPSITLHAVQIIKPEVFIASPYIASTVAVFDKGGSWIGSYNPANPTPNDNPKFAVPAFFAFDSTMIGDPLDGALSGNMMSYAYTGLNDYSTDNSSSIAVMINYPFDNDLSVSGSEDYARLYSWAGIDLLPANMLLNYRTGYLEVLSPYYNKNVAGTSISDRTVKTNIPYVWVMSALGYSQVFYTKINASFNLNAASVGNLLNACDTTGGYYSESGSGGCPMRNGLHFGFENVYFLYRTDPKTYGTDLSSFEQSLGYRWCRHYSATPVTNRCGTDNNATHSVNEFALKNMIKTHWYNNSIGDEYEIRRVGNTDYVKNLGTHDVSLLQRYEAIQPADDSSGDPGFKVTLYQPVLSAYNGGVNNEVSSSLLANGNGPLATTFQWEIRINPNTGRLNTTGTVFDIVDVYMDIDADGIPDPWDDHPLHFDIDNNGELDGFQYLTGLEEGITYDDTLFVYTIGGCTEDAGNPYGNHYIWTCDTTPILLNYEGPSGRVYPAYNSPVASVLPDTKPYDFPAIDYYYLNFFTDLKDSVKTNATSGKTLLEFIPETLTNVDYFHHPESPEGALYIICGETIPPVVTIYPAHCRQVIDWSPDPEEERRQKSRFINADYPGIGTDFVLNRSAEKEYFINGLTSHGSPLDSDLEIYRTNSTNLWP